MTSNIKFMCSIVGTLKSLRKENAALNLSAKIANDAAKLAEKKCCEIYKSYEELKETQDVLYEAIFFETKEYLPGGLNGPVKECSETRPHYNIPEP